MRLKIATLAPLPPLKAWTLVPASVTSIHALRAHIYLQLCSSLPPKALKGKRAADIALEVQGFELLDSTGLEVLDIGTDVVDIKLREVTKPGKRKCGADERADAFGGVSKKRKLEANPSPASAKPKVVRSKEPAITARPPADLPGSANLKSTLSKTGIPPRGRTRSGSSSTSSTSPTSSPSTSSSSSSSGSDSDWFSSSSDSDSDSDSESDSESDSDSERPQSLPPTKLDILPVLKGSGVSLQSVHARSLTVRLDPKPIENPVPPGRGTTATQSRNLRRRAARKAAQSGDKASESRNGQNAVTGHPSEAMSSQSPAALPGLSGSDKSTPIPTTVSNSVPHPFGTPQRQQLARSASSGGKDFLSTFMDSPGSSPGWRSFPHPSDVPKNELPANLIVTSAFFDGAWQKGTPQEEDSEKENRKQKRARAREAREKLSGVAHGGDSEEMVELVAASGDTPSTESELTTAIDPSGGTLGPVNLTTIVGGQGELGLEEWRWLEEADGRMEELSCVGEATLAVGSLVVWKEVLLNIVTFTPELTLRAGVVKAIHGDGTHRRYTLEIIMRPAEVLKHEGGEEGNAWEGARDDNGVEWGGADDGDEADGDEVEEPRELTEADLKAGMYRLVRAM